MLPPFIIEQIRRREAEERVRKEANRPRLELPLAPHRPMDDHQEPPEVERGVIVVDL
jgi:hypothetical protein